MSPARLFTRASWRGPAGIPEDVGAAEGTVELVEKDVEVAFVRLVDADEKLEGAGVEVDNHVLFKKLDCETVVDEDATKLVVMFVGCCENPVEAKLVAITNDEDRVKVVVASVVKLIVVLVVSWGVDGGGTALLNGVGTDTFELDSVELIGAGRPELVDVGGSDGGFELDGSDVTGKVSIEITSDMITVDTGSIGNVVVEISDDTKLTVGSGPLLAKGPCPSGGVSWYAGPCLGG